LRSVTPVINATLKCLEPDGLARVTQRHNFAVQ
jgi:hypothetical protein